MYSKLTLAQKYLRYYFTASNGNGHGMHSPFVFDFITNVLNDKKEYAAYQHVERLRSDLKKDRSLLEVIDLGAGSSVSKQIQRSVSDIASHAAKPKKYGQLLYRIVRYYKPQAVVELGTSLGLTTCYLALANKETAVYTLEGAPAVAAIAKENFSRLSIHNVRVQTGSFDDTLPGLLDTIPIIDCCFIDGNHRMAPTLDYFNQLLQKINTQSILIFDDIHWSKDMEQAWEIIKSHPSVRLSIDIFFLGMVFFRDEFKIKQHFLIRY